MMADKPVLFSGPMVRALIAGTKTQTRRAFKGIVDEGDGRFHIVTPHGGVYGLTEESVPSWAPDYLRIAVGDRLWVRESLKIESTDQGVRYPTYAADGAKLWPLSEWTRDRNSVPSIHMPRWASRITLEITGVLLIHAIRLNARPPPAPTIASTCPMGRDAASCLSRTSSSANPTIAATISRLPRRLSRDGVS